MPPSTYLMPQPLWPLRLSCGRARTRWSHDSNSLTAPELAARLNIPVNWLYVQIREKRLLVDRQPSGAYLFQDSPVVLDAVRKLRNHTINRLDLRICQPHQEGYQHG